VLGAILCVSTTPRELRRTARKDQTPPRNTVEEQKREEKKQADGRTTGEPENW
jgi:hypothetical protein